MISIALARSDSQSLANAMGPIPRHASVAQPQPQFASKPAQVWRNDRPRAPHGDAAQNAPRPAVGDAERQ